MDLERVEKLLSLFERSRAQALAVEADGWRVALRRGVVVGGELAPLSPEPEEPALDGAPAEVARTSAPAIPVTAPLVGIFREAEARIEPGDRVQAGAAVGAIESMKILSPVLAQADGWVEDVLVEDGHPVEYGEPLFLLRPLEGVGEGEGVS